MRKRERKPPLCIVIAGPNGAGKTTFAREFLLKDAGIVHFVNPDLIAGGLSPCDQNSLRWQRAVCSSAS